MLNRQLLENFVPKPYKEHDVVLLVFYFLAVLDVNFAPFIPFSQILIRFL